MSSQLTGVPGKMRGVPARWGDPARGIPTLLDHVHAEEHHELGPLPPFKPGPPFWPGALRPSCTSLGKAARGPGSRGVPARGFLVPAILNSRMENAQIPRFRNVSVAMPADSRCEREKFEIVVAIVFEMSGAELWKVPVKSF